MAKGMTPKHTACRPGTEVVIKLRDGTKLFDTFMDRRGGTIFLKEYGRINKKDMRSFAVRKRRP